MLNKLLIYSLGTVITIALLPIFILVAIHASFEWIITSK